MPTAFDFMTEALFGDPNMAEDAEWRMQGVSPATAIKVLKRTPDEIADWNGGSFVVGTLLLEVKIADVPDLAEGDTITIGVMPYEIKSKPQKDAEGLTWLTQARAVY